MNYLNQLSTSSDSVKVHLEEEKQGLSVLNSILNVINNFRDHKTFQSHMHFPVDLTFKYNQDMESSIYPAPQSYVKIVKLTNQHDKNVLVITGLDSKMEIPPKESIENIIVPPYYNFKISSRTGEAMLYDIIEQKYISS